MMDTLDLGATPANEACAQVGSDNYSERALAECRIYRRQLVRLYQSEHGGNNLPGGCSLKITSNSHDFGTYHEVGVRYDQRIPEAVDAAFWFEGNLPGEWDEEAHKELEELFPAETPTFDLRASNFQLGR